MLPFTSAGTPGAFRPLVPDPSATAISGVAPLQQWGTQRPFVVGSVAPFLARAPYGAATLAEAVQTPQYLADYAETRALGGVVSQRSQDQTDIGYFWIESPARGWNEVARAILSQRQETAWRTARLLAQVHLAMADAFIANFDSKYHWKFWRPVTAIRLGNMDPSTPGDPTWDAASSATGRNAPHARVALRARHGRSRGRRGAQAGNPRHHPVHDDDDDRPPRAPALRLGR
jgi:hypothetical protein